MLFLGIYRNFRTLRLETDHAGTWCTNPHGALVHSSIVFGNPVLKASGPLKLRTPSENREYLENKTVLVALLVEFIDVPPLLQPDLP